jgi:hypothetical protein
VIHDVDEAVRTLIRRDALAGTDVELMLDAPTKEWSAKRNSPTVDAYLYDIREDLRRREVGRIDVLDADGKVVERRPPARYFKLSYLITAWTQRPEDEHRLLSAVLACFLRYERLPSDVLSGLLAETHLPVAVTVALPPPEDRPISDVWSALGGELKPSLDLVITVPFLTGQAELAGSPVLESIRLDIARRLEAAEAPAEKSTRHKSARRTTTLPAPAHPALPPEDQRAQPDEVVTGGGADSPGRLMRVRDMSQD